MFFLFVTLSSYEVCDNGNAIKQCNFQNNKKYVLSKSESVQCNFFHFWSRDIHQVQNMLLCTKFHENRMIFFAEIWRYIDCQNGSRPPFWYCFTIIRDHQQSLCCWPQLSVKFHVNLIHISVDIAIWIFRIFCLKCLSRPPKWGFGGFWTHKCDYSSSRPPKATSLHKSTSVKLSTIKIRWGVWPVGELIESVTNTQTHTHR